MFGFNLGFIELFTVVFFLFGYAALLLKQRLAPHEAHFLLGVFASGLALNGVRMIDLALANAFTDLLALVLLFIVGLLLAFVANAKGGFVASRRIKK
ncbi:MAG: hypothetical protein QW343_00305 [Candidatus Norongarragalinales archaeon]